MQRYLVTMITVATWYENTHGETAKYMQFQ